MNSFTHAAMPVTSSLAKLLAANLHDPKLRAALETDYAGEQFAQPALLDSSEDQRRLAVKNSPLDDLTSRIIHFQATHFPNQTLLGKLTHLVKEATELRDCNGMDRHEWADVLILLLGAAGLEGLTPADLIRLAHEKLDICYAREWPAEPGPDGCFHHIKES